MSFDYDGRSFRTVSNTEGGETNAETVFHYRQEGDIVWATYKGGEVIFGTLLAKADEEGRLDMRYRQLSRSGEWRGGRTSRRARPSSKSSARLKFSTPDTEFRLIPNVAGAAQS